MRLKVRSAQYDRVCRDALKNERRSSFVNSNEQDIHLSLTKKEENALRNFFSTKIDSRDLEPRKEGRSIFFSEIASTEDSTPLSETFGIVFGVF